MPPPSVRPRDARCGDHAPCRCQAKGRGLPVELPPGDAPLGLDRLAAGIDPDAFHRTQVDDEATLTDAMAGRMVSTPAHGHEHLVRLGKAHGGEHIGDARAACDQRRSLVDHGVKHRAGRVIAVIAGTEQGPAQARLEVLHGGLREDRLLACGCHDA